MPLRRRPPAPSPRVRALLASTADPQTAPAGTTPWQPDRSWLLSAQQGGTPASAAPPSPDRQDRPGRHRRPSPPAPRLFTLPRALQGARLAAPRAATLGLLLVVLAAAGLFSTRVVLARAASTPHPVHGSAASGSALSTSTAARTTFGQFGAGPGPGASRSSATTQGSTAAGSGGLVTVHVVGQVRHAGVVTLASGSRVVDALTKAGGALPAADLPALNLARVLVDGEQIRVTRPGERPAVAAPAGTTAAPGSAEAGTGGVLNLNQATAAQLDELPGVGPVLAQRIVEWRTAHGRFATVDELSEVSGIGDKIFAELQARVSV